MVLRQPSNCIGGGPPRIAPNPAPTPPPKLGEGSTAVARNEQKAGRGRGPPRVAPSPASSPSSPFSGVREELTASIPIFDAKAQRKRANLSVSDMFSITCEKEWIFLK
jgi:hypothetical protein